MADVTLSSICTAIRNTLATATGLNVAQDTTQITEGIHDLPLLQVYPESGEVDPSGRTDRTTFGAGVQQDRMVIHADLYVRQRSHLQEDMDTLIDMIDAVIYTLKHDAADTMFGGLDNFQGFHWSWQRVIFEYGDPLAKYVGARFRIEVTTF